MSKYGCCDALPSGCPCINPNTVCCQRSCCITSCVWLIIDSRVYDEDKVSFVQAKNLPKSRTQWLHRVLENECEHKCCHLEYMVGCVLHLIERQSTPLPDTPPKLSLLIRTWYQWICGHGYKWQRHILYEPLYSFLSTIKEIIGRNSMSNHWSFSHQTAS